MGTSRARNPTHKAQAEGRTEFPPCCLRTPISYMVLFFVRFSFVVSIPTPVQEEKRGGWLAMRVAEETKRGPKVRVRRWGYFCFK